jgi:hypothetical protein
MDRKKAIIGAATVAGSLLAASSAYALTSGIVGNGGDDGAGNLTPVLDVAPTEGSTVPSTSVDGSPDPTSNRGDDDSVTVEVPHTDDDGDDELEDRDSEDEHEDEAVETHEYEGREDDD